MPPSLKPHAGPGARLFRARVLASRSLLLRRPCPFRYSSSASSAADASSLRSRFGRFNNRLPRFLRRYTGALFNAPVSHISAFLILHEITAVVPLFGLAALFHYTEWLPAWASEWISVSQGVEKFGNYFRRKGWIGPNEKAEIDAIEEDGKWTVDNDEMLDKQNTFAGTRIVIEFATAYAITKALLPIRIPLSVWATPWFAAWAVTPLTREWSRLVPVTMRASAGASRTKTVPRVSPAAGTNAVGGGALPKDP